MDDQEVEQNQGEDKKMDDEEEPGDNEVGDEDELEEEVIQKLESDLKRKLEELGGIDDNGEMDVNSGETGKRKIQEVEEGENPEGKLK